MEFCAVHAQLFQCQHFRSGIHGSSGNDHRRNVHSCQSHKVCWHTLIAAGQKNSCVKRRGICMYFYHIGNHFPTGKTEVNPIRPLAFPIAYICTEITRAMASRLFNSLAYFLHQNIQMSASRVTVPKSTLY